MNKSFKCAETQKIWEGEYSKKLPSNIQNIHPGEVLLEEFLKPLGISQNKSHGGLMRLFLNDEPLQLTQLFVLYFIFVH